MKKIYAMLLMLGVLSGMAYFCTGESALANTTEAEETVSEVSYKTVEMTIHIEAVNGEDIAAKLDGALKEARDSATDAVPVTVKVPAGNYQWNYYGIYSKYFRVRCGRYFRRLKSTSFWKCH